MSVIKTAGLFLKGYFGSFGNEKQKGECPPIDFVVAWVDGNDPAWRTEKESYLDKADAYTKEETKDFHFRDWGIFKYWFRSVEKNAPWVNHIYFVTWGHVPEWLDTSNPKITVVKHEDFIPKEFLPTFNANTIETNLHRIKGLSENFVFFNDDMYLNSPFKPTDFFVNGKAVYPAIFLPVANVATNSAFRHMLLSNASLILKMHDVREIVKKNPKLFFSHKYGIYAFTNIFFAYSRPYGSLHFLHMYYPLRKQDFEKVWSECEKEMTESCVNKFRHPYQYTDVLFLAESAMQGGMIPCKMFGHVYLLSHYERIKADMEKEKNRVFCLNDVWNMEDTENVRANLQKIFEDKYPEKSSFEK